ncbi:MAG: amidohydrolase family protein [Gemmatimonadetes bacterium]|jgi:imidazolonepropionase-like amidohydrolase|nr:amidohydrolase family protein [Gemmatimonadota bacterium]
MRAHLWVLSLALAASTARAQTVAIIGGTVHPVSGPRIENGTVLIRDGKVVAVGADVAIPADARRIDARGKWVTPGFINAATTLGLSEAGDPQFSGGYNDGGARGAHGINASFDAWKGLNPANTFIIPARHEGVTSVVVAPGSGMVAGRMALIDLIDATTPTEMLRKGPAGMVGDFGNPGNGEAGARAEYWAKWRTLLDDVKAYQTRRAAYEMGNSRELAAPRSELEALIPVVTGQLPLALSVDRASDILAALAFASEYKLRLWIVGGAESWIVAKEIAAARVPVFTGAMSNIPGDFASLGQRQETAALLRAAGVTVVLIGNGPGGPGDFNVRNMRQEAGNAVAYGLTWEEALRAITLTPAEVLGVADQIGAIAVGRDANVVVWSGDPFEFGSVAEQVFVRGRTFATKSRQQQLTERYLTLPPAYRRP